MSLILEALRKSEAERRRGQTPDLFAELPPVVQQRGPALSVWHWFALAVFLFVVLAWLARERWSSSAGIASSVDTDTPADRTSHDRPAAAAPEAEASPQAATDSNVIAARDAIAAAPIPPSVASPSPSSIPETAPVEADIVTPVQTPVAVASPLSPKPLPASAATPAPPPAVTSIPEPTDRSGTLLQLADLSAEQRRQLPPLKMSMHMWNQDPARRFVIIDGARLGEGDRIGDAVIDRITADSVVLDWNGRRLRLSLR